ncbi:ADP-ribosylglycohydrolase family protein [Allocoleopsis sp.]|uniref:ADP-ribosylglycohydrolase family protein n=1 Tax=Allocoleopsis sp. TaxID=3088169 RepID=UPI002FD0D49F
MKYSLLSRFRGALLGSFVGESLVCVGYQNRLWGGVSFTSPKPEEAQTNQTLSDWSQLATCGTESLIRCGKVNLEDWWLLFEKTPSSVSFKSAGTSSEAAVATLPIALFFHEDEVKLRQQLLACADVLQHKSEAPEAISVVAYAIALALTEKLDVATLIPQTLDYLGTSQIPLKRQLEQVQMLLEQGAGLDTTLTHLRRDAQKSRGEPLGRSHIAIALAFYCFLATPEDFRLSVSRAARSQYQPQITAALTGALAGVYNSIIGIPVGWRLAANRISSGIQRLQLADRLFEVWAGVYDVPPFAQGQLLTVAAPRVIQPR